MVTVLSFLVIVQYLPLALSFKRQPEDFTCKIAQEGYHILGKAECGLKVWKDSKRGEPITLDYNNAGACAYHGVSDKVRKELLKAVGLGKPEKHQPKPAFFTAQGERLTKGSLLSSILDAGDPVFLIAGGQFQWPPVEAGFRTVVEGIEVGGKPVELETLAVVPPIFRVHNLASKEETEALIEHAKPHFVQADVVYMDKDKGKDVNEFRTSLNYRPPHNATPLLTAMESRATSATRMPFSHLEAVQVLYYKKGGYYHAHDDSSQLQFYIGDRGQLQRKHYGYFDRMLTLFWYMNDVPQGGQTNFPRASGNAPLGYPPSMRKCTQGIMVPPVAGQAVLWYNMYAHGQVSPFALHAACAVEAGEKYAINVWIYNKPMHTPPAEWDPDHPRVKHLEKLAGKKAGTNEPLGNANSNNREIKLVNKGESAAQIYWQGPNGLSLMNDNLAPGQEVGFQTFVGHTFVAKNGDTEIASCTITPAGTHLQICMVGGKTEL